MRTLYLTGMRSSHLITVKALREAARACGYDPFTLEYAGESIRKYRDVGYARLFTVPHDVDAGKLIAALSQNGVLAEIDPTPERLFELDVRDARAQIAAVPDLPPPTVSEEGWMLALVLLAQSGGNAALAAVQADQQRTAAPTHSDILSEAVSGLSKAFPGLQAGLTKAGIKWEL